MCFFCTSVFSSSVTCSVYARNLNDIFLIFQRMVQNARSVLATKRVPLTQLRATLTHAIQEVLWTAQPINVDYVVVVWFSFSFTSLWNYDKEIRRRAIIVGSMINNLQVHKNWKGRNENVTSECVKNSRPRALCGVISLIGTLWQNFELGPLLP